MSNVHVFVSCGLEDLTDLIGQLEGLKKVAETAYAVDSDPEDPDYKPDVRVKLESKDYGDGWNLTVTY